MVRGIGHNGLKWQYLVAAVVIIIIGLNIRKVEFLPDEAGDALWAMVVFCCWRMILPGKSLLYVALVSLLTSYAVEFSQLIRWDWLNDFRSTTIGHLLLGQGFLWTDIIAYTIGIAVISFIVWAINRLKSR